MSSHWLTLIIVPNYSHRTVFIVKKYCHYGQLLSSTYRNSNWICSSTLFFSSSDTSSASPTLSVYHKYLLIKKQSEIETIIVITAFEGLKNPDLSPYFCEK